MPSLDEDFGQLVERLTAPRSLTGNGGDPFFYFCFDPSQTLEVRRRLPAWEGRLRNAGFAVERASFVDLLWGLVDATGWWEQWLEAEADGDFDQGQINDSVSAVLREGDALVGKVRAVVEQGREQTVVFLTETEALHPYFRARTLESRLHDRVKVPTVVFYPGRRVGQYGLRFPDLYPEDSNYRATIIGGLP